MTIDTTKDALFEPRLILRASDCHGRLELYELVGFSGISAYIQANELGYMKERA